MQTRISVDDLRVNCCIGVLDPERVKPQPLRVDLTIQIDARQAVASDSLRQTRDYDRLAEQIAFILETGRFHLIETAAHVLLRWLLIPPDHAEAPPPVQWARLCLTKPEALPGTATPRVVVEAHAHAQVYERERKPWGFVDIVAEATHVGFYRLTLLPQQVLPEHYHLRLREAELVVSRGLELWKDGGVPEALPLGTRLSWTHGQRHGYRNQGKSAASLLCMDSPPFDSADEIKTGDPPPLEHPCD